MMLKERYRALDRSGTQLLPRNWEASAPYCGSSRAQVLALCPRERGHDACVHLDSWDLVRISIARFAAPGPSSGVLSGPSNRRPQTRTWKRQRPSPSTE